VTHLIFLDWKEKEGMGGGRSCLSKMQAEFPEVYAAMLGPDGQVDHLRVKAAVHEMHACSGKR
jgi:hypothetical protein